MINKKLFTGLFLAILFFLTPGVYAKISVMPVRQEITVSPGGMAEGSYFVTNLSNEKTYVKINPRDWFKLKENTNINIDSWLEILPQEFELKAHEKKEIKYKVTLPQEVIGELVGMIAFHPQAPKGAMINVVFSVSLYVIIEGTEIVEGEIESVDVGNREDKKGNRYFYIGLGLKNKGNVHLRPKIKAIIKKKKKQITSIDFPYGWPVYPGRVSGYVGDLKGRPLFPKGKYRAVITVDYGRSEDILEKVVPFKIDKRGNVKKKSKKLKKKEVIKGS
ncbi:hypothetical protein KAU39_04560 [bacterium]|nr:hypothetical protein [bacterium]